MSKTVVALCNAGGELDRIELSEHNATDNAIATAAVSLIARTGYSLGTGDSITITEESGTVDRRHSRR